MTVEQAYTRYAMRVVPERGTDDVEPFIADIELELGLVMRSRAVIADGEDDDGALHLDLSAAARPARHARAARRHRRGPLDLDLFGRSFVLLRAPGAGADDGRRRVSRPMSSTPTASPRPTASRPAARSLVRPDGIVGWRSKDGLDREELSRALDAILAREAAYA